MADRSSHRRDISQAATHSTLEITQASLHLVSSQALVAQFSLFHCSLFSPSFFHCSSYLHNTEFIEVLSTSLLYPGFSLKGAVTPLAHTTKSDNDVIQFLFLPKPQNPSATPSTIEAAIDTTTTTLFSRTVPFVCSSPNGLLAFLSLASHQGT